MKHRSWALSFAAAVAAILVLATVVPASAGVLYTQPWDGTSNSFASQNDPNTFGLFANTIDNFSVAQNSTINEIAFTGNYFNGPTDGNGNVIPGTITSWEVVFYDASLNVLYDQSIAGNGGETFIGDVGGFPEFTYDFGIPNFSVNGATPYWVSVIPTSGFPPHWGWATSSTGDGQAIQCFFGSCSTVAADMAFTLSGSSSGTTPEPSSLLLLGTGVLGLAGTIRKKLF